MDRKSTRGHRVWKFVGLALCGLSLSAVTAQPAQAGRWRRGHRHAHYRVYRGGYGRGPGYYNRGYYGGYYGTPYVGGVYPGVVGVPF